MLVPLQRLGQVAGVTQLVWLQLPGAEARACVPGYKGTE